MKGLGESFFANTNFTAQDCAIQEIAEIVALGGSWKCVGDVGVLECFRASFRALFGRSSSTSILMLFYAVRCGGMVQYVHFFVLAHKKYIMVVLYVSRYVIYFSRTL